MLLQTWPDTQTLHQLESHSQQSWTEDHCFVQQQQRPAHSSQKQRSWDVQTYSENKWKHLPQASKRLQVQVRSCWCYRLSCRPVWEFLHYYIYVKSCKGELPTEKFSYKIKLKIPWMSPVNNGESLLEFWITIAQVVLCTHYAELRSFWQDTQAPYCVSKGVSKEASIILMRHRGEKICKNVTSFTFKGKQHFLPYIFSIIKLRQMVQVWQLVHSWGIQASRLHILLGSTAQWQQELSAESSWELSETKFSIAKFMGGFLSVVSIS